jgi:hypothetical protein
LMKADCGPRDGLSGNLQGFNLLTLKRIPIGEI